MKNTELHFQNKIKLHIFEDAVSGSNCFIWEENGHVMVIDPNKEEIVQWIESNHLIPDLVLLTHEHCDHIGGLNQLRDCFPVPVMCTKVCSDNIQNQRMNMSSIMELYVYYYSGKRIQYTPFICDKAEDTFLEHREFTWNSCQIKAEAVTGHTKGSCIYQVEQDGETLLFTGDYLIQGEKVITRLQAGDPDGYLSWGRGRLLEIPNGMHVYPGHGKDYWLDEQGEWKNGL